VKVLGVGESVIDTYIIKGATTKDSHIGGSVLAALIFLSRLGIDCEFFTSLGKDDEAHIIKTALNKEKIECHVHEQEKTKVNTIIVNDRNGQRTKKRSTIEHTRAKHIDADYLRQFDLIIVDRHMPELFYEVVSKKSPDAKILIDTSTEISEFTKDMIRHADYPIVPIETLSALTTEADMLASIIKLYQISKTPVTITMGELGSLLYDGSRIEFLPSLMIKAVDTNGAGDVYRGAFAYGTLSGWDQRTCAIFANTAAGLQCTRLGNVAAIPDKKLVELHLQRPRHKLELDHAHAYFKKLCSNTTPQPLSAL